MTSTEASNSSRNHWSRRIHTTAALAMAGVSAAWTQGVPVDERMHVTDGVWAIGDATGVWPLTYMGKYQGRVAADNILGRNRAANYDAVPRVVFTDPQAAVVGESEGALFATVPMAECRAPPPTRARTRTAQAS